MNENSSEMFEEINSHRNRFNLSIQPHPRSQLQKLIKGDFLANGELRILDVKMMIRSKLKLDKTESIFIYIGKNKRLCNDSTSAFQSRYSYKRGL